MAIIIPFKAYRPVKELASKIAALPYDVMNTEEAREMVEENEYSFLHVDRGEINFPGKVNIYSEEVYKKSREVLDEMIEKKYYIQDENQCFYIYRQTMNGKSQIGLVMCASVDDYINNIIKKSIFSLLFFYLQFDIFSTLITCWLIIFYFYNFGKYY